MPRAARLALVTVPVVLGLGMLSGWLSGSGYGDPWFAELRKPAFMPPSWLFPVAWTLLYVLLGIAVARLLASPRGPLRRGALRLFIVQLLLNLAWSPLFFGLHRAQAALALIVALVATAALAALAALRVDRWAAWLMLPYLAWLVLATALNQQIVSLN